MLKLQISNIISLIFFIVLLVCGLFVFFYTQLSLKSDYKIMYFNLIFINFFTDFCSSVLTHIFVYKLKYVFYINTFIAFLFKFFFKITKFFLKVFSDCSHYNCFIFSSSCSRCILLGIPPGSDRYEVALILIFIGIIYTSAGILLLNTEQIDAKNTINVETSSTFEEKCTDFSSLSEKSNDQNTHFDTQCSVLFKQSKSFTNQDPSIWYVTFLLSTIV